MKFLRRDKTVQHNDLCFMTRRDDKRNFSRRDGTGFFFCSTGRDDIFFFHDGKRRFVLFFDGTERYLFFPDRKRRACLSTWTSHVPRGRSGPSNLCCVVGCFRDEKSHRARGRTTGAVAARPPNALEHSLGRMCFHPSS